MYLQLMSAYVTALQNPHKSEPAARTRSAHVCSVFVTGSLPARESLPAFVELAMIRRTTAEKERARSRNLRALGRSRGARGSTGPRIARISTGRPVFRPSPVGHGVCEADPVRKSCMFSAVCPLPSVRPGQSLLFAKLRHEDAGALPQREAPSVRREPQGQTEGRGAPKASPGQPP